jgi:hypothetical protein
MVGQQKGGSKRPPSLFDKRKRGVSPIRDQCMVMTSRIVMTSWI